MGRDERKAARQEKRAANNERYHRKMAEIEEKKNRRLAEIKAKGEARREKINRPAQAPAPSSVPVAPSGEVELDFKGMLTVRGGQLHMSNGKTEPIRGLIATVHWGPQSPEYTNELMGMFGAAPMLSKRHRFHHWLTIRTVAPSLPVAFLQIDKADKPAAQQFADAFNALPRSS